MKLANWKLKATVNQKKLVTSTMLDQLNSAEEFLNQALIVAPGEGETPLSLFWDKHCEEASFVNIYCGMLRNFPKGISYCDQARWDLTNIDRRVAHNIDNIFFKIILALLVDGKVIMEEEAARMDIKTRQRLVASDPVTCARYWQHYMDLLLTAACSCDSVMGHVENFFLRDEFQQRDSPHSHGLLSSQVRQSTARRRMQRSANLSPSI
jgi:hypothetical protein